MEYVEVLLHLSALIVLMLPQGSRNIKSLMRARETKLALSRGITHNRL
jgi:hypothetical protein